MVKVKGQYGDCYLLGLAATKKISDTILIRRIDIKEKLRNVVNEDFLTDEAYGLCKVAEKELATGEWDTQAEIVNGSNLIINSGKEFSMKMDNLFTEIFSQWSVVDEAIKKMLENLKTLAANTRSSNIPARDILSELSSIGRTTLPDIEAQLRGMESYHDNIKDANNSFTTIVQHQYDSMRQADEKIYESEPSKDWWGKNYKGKIDVDAERDSRFIEDDLTGVLNILNSK